MTASRFEQVALDDTDTMRQAAMLIISDLHRRNAASRAVNELDLRIRSHTLPEGAIHYVLRSGTGAVIGAGMATEDRADGTVWVHELAIRQDLQGLGLGRLFLGHLAITALDKGCSQIALIPTSSATGFYEKLGFNFTNPPHQFMEAPAWAVLATRSRKR